MTDSKTNNRKRRAAPAASSQEASGGGLSTLDSRLSTPVTIDARNMPYRDLNAQIRQAAAEGRTAFELVNVNGQRYIADGLHGDIKIDVRGVPGNDLGAFMDGPQIVVHNNAQDAVANTMNNGRIVVRGDAGDVLAYGMRGGRLYVRGCVGYRVGIHMKAYQDQMPVVIAGEGAADFLGEYMAGGILVVLSLSGKGECRVGDFCATGMHGGEIFLRCRVDPYLVATEHVKMQPATEADIARLRPFLEDFCAAFDLNIESVLAEPFTRISPLSARPFSAKYAT